MNLNQVLFLGNGLPALPSVQIRCGDIAKRLGCAYRLGVRSADQIVRDYAVFICVKSNLPLSELRKLAARGKVIWDIIDSPPPPDHISVYLASNKVAQDLFSRYGQVELLPHHHCNFEGTPNPPELRRPVWIGARQWRPTLAGFDHDIHLVNGMKREDVVRLFRQTGIGLNLRGNDVFKKQIEPELIQNDKTAKERQRITKSMCNFHLVVNSGIKLINCLGFGIPSISSDEPAYHEIGAECTIFSTAKQCARWVRALQSDDELYLKYRERALRKAQDYHIDTIAGKYRKLIESL